MAISFDLKTAKPSQRVAVPFDGVDPRATYKVVVNGGKPVTMGGNRLASEGLMLN